MTNPGWNIGGATAMPSKRALVTGGTKGIGAAIVRELQGMGMEVETFGTSTGVDIFHEPSVQEYLYNLDPIDVLINNLGGGGRFGLPNNYHKVQPEVWKDCLEKNLGAMIRFTNHVLPHMLKVRWGRVVTIASIHGMEAGGRPWFMAAKAAEIAAMKSYSKNPDYVFHGVTFNTVCPGHIKVAGKPIVETNSPLCRMGEPEEVAALVAWICSKEASLLNGASIPIDGGESVSL